MDQLNIDTEISQWENSRAQGWSRKAVFLSSCYGYSERMLTANSVALKDTSAYLYWNYVTVSKIICVITDNTLDYSYFVQFMRLKS